MIFISMLGKAELAAAVGYAGAILFFTTSFGIGMAIACGALVARALGAGRRWAGAPPRHHPLIFGVLFGAVFAALVWVNLHRLVTLLGATGGTLDLSVHLLRIILPSAAVPADRHGRRRDPARPWRRAARDDGVLIWGGVVNAMLDPILIFGLGP